MSSLYLASAHLLRGFFLSNADPIAQDFATVLQIVVFEGFTHLENFV